MPAGSTPRRAAVSSPASTPSSAGLVDELGGLQLALSIAKAKAGIDEAQPIRVRRFPAEDDRWQKIVDRVMRLAGVDARGPTIRAPREIREALARFGIAGRPGNVRLPPLPPLWRLRATRYHVRARRAGRRRRSTSSRHWRR